MLIATSVKLFEDIYGYDKGFFHFFSPVELPELSQEEVAEMLRRLGQADDNAEFLSRLERSKVNLSTLYFLNGGNPRFVGMLYHVLSNGGFGEPARALWEMVGGLTPMLRQELADMPRQQSKTLDALLRLKGAATPAEISKYSRLPLNVVTTQLGRLKAARYVALEGGGKGKKATYRVADQMFSVWYWMRYVPVARRRIELFVDFLRAWFSVDERRSLFQDRWERFHTCHSRDLVGMAGKALRDAEYYAASLEDPTERNREMERIADAYITAGDWPSAAALFAELEGTQVKSIRKFESLGYWVLGNRLVEKGDVERALKSYSEALARDPKNTGARVNFGLCLVLSERPAEAKEQLDQIVKKPRLSVELRSQVLFGRAAAKYWLGDHEGEVADYNAVVELPGAAADVVASALLNRGLTKGKMGDSQGEIADYTALVELKGAPAEEVAKALFNRAVAKSRLGDPQGEMTDYTAAVLLDGAPVEQVAKALVNRGVAKGEQGDFQGAMEDYTAVVELQGAPAEQVARALFWRGLTKGEQGDPHAAIKDYSATVELKGVPLEQAASALLSRGLAKGRVGDSQGAIADSTELLQIQNAPTEVKVMALVLRGVLHSQLGQHELALKDFDLSLETPKLPDGIRIQAIFNRGVAAERMGKTEEALADYARCAQSGNLPYAHIGLRSTVRLLLSEKSVDEALGWVRRFHGLEPHEASLETRLEARLDMIRAASGVASLDDTSRLVDALLESDPEELRARLQFLKPGLELAKTHDESVLANLPEDERKIAREIARSLAESARPPAGQPPS
jgi:tetratricopeptide (TPR) repeat protein